MRTGAPAELLLQLIPQLLFSPFPSHKPESRTVEGPGLSYQNRMDPESLAQGAQDLYVLLLSYGGRDGLMTRAVFFFVSIVAKVRSAATP